MKSYPFYLVFFFSIFALQAQTGIGTTSPKTKLHVKDNGGAFRIEGTDHVFMELYPQGATTRYGYFGYPGASSTVLTFMNQYSTGTMAWGTNNTTRMFLLSDGKLGIGNSSPGSTLTVGSTDGTVPGEITLNPTAAANEGGQINFKRSLNGSTVDWSIDQYGTSAADARFRIFNTSELNGMVIKENGFIAQELQKIMPSLVIEGTDKDKLLSVNYTALIPVLTQALQEQQKAIQAQQNVNQEQQKQIEELKLLVLSMKK